VLVGALLSLLVLGGAVAALAPRREEPEVPARAAGPVPFSEQVAADQRAPLPPRTLEGFADGPPVDLAAYRGVPLVVNFWATWCAPCVEEMPAFQEVAAQAGERVAFLGVDVADAPRQAEPFVRELGIDYDLARDPDRTFAQEVGVFAMPTTLFVDADGTIVHRQVAPLDADALRGALRDHLGVDV
jgi:thiol-disulfide isomerase/thioredoxin